MAWRHPSWNCFLGLPLGVRCGLEWEGGKRGGGSLGMVKSLGSLPQSLLWAPRGPGLARCSRRTPT